MQLADRTPGQGWRWTFAIIGLIIIIYVIDTGNVSGPTTIKETLLIKPDQWSDWIHLEKGDMLRFDPPFSAKCEFSNGQIFDISQPTEWNLKSEIKFRFYGNDGRAEITVTRKFGSSVLRREAGGQPVVSEDRGPFDSDSSIASGKKKSKYILELERLEKTGGSPTDYLIKLLLYEEELEARVWAAKTLGTLGADANKAIPALIVALKEQKNWWINGGDLRVAAANTLIQIGEPAVPALIEVVKNREPTHVNDAGFYAIQALGLIGQKAKPALPTLKLVLIKSDGSRSVIKETIRAVERIDSDIAPQVFTDVLALIYREPSADSVACSIELIDELGIFGSKSKCAIPLLRKIKEHPRSHLNHAAEKALVLIEFLTDKGGQGKD